MPPNGDWIFFHSYLFIFTLGCGFEGGPCTCIAVAGSGAEAIGSEQGASAVSRKKCSCELGSAFQDAQDPEAEASILLKDWRDADSRMQGRPLYPAFSVGDLAL